jgi:hypothetical protein
MRITRTDVMALSVIAASGLTGFALSALSALSFSSVERTVTVTTDWQSVGEMPEMSEEKVLRFEDSNGRIRVEREERHRDGDVDRRRRRRRHPRSEVTRFRTDATPSVEGHEMQWQSEDNVVRFRIDSSVRIRSSDSDVALQPLIYIDGERTERNISELSPDDIERVEVVKGAAAVELYGEEAEGGVIQIFTKNSMTREPGN